MARCTQFLKLACPTLENDSPLALMARSGID
jgi:hypothetical protein